MPRLDCTCRGAAVEEAGGEGSRSENYLSGGRPSRLDCTCTYGEGMMATTPPTPSTTNQGDCLRYRPSANGFSLLCTTAVALCAKLHIDCHHMHIPPYQVHQQTGAPGNVCHAGPPLE